LIRWLIIASILQVFV